MGQARDRGKRAERKRGADRRREEARLDVRRRVKGLLQRFKLLAEFEAMPAYVRDQFYHCCLPDPVLVFDPSFPSADAFGGAYAEIRDEVTFGFEHAGIYHEGFILPVKDFTAIAAPIAAMVKRTVASFHLPAGDVPRMPASIRAFMEKAAVPLNRLCCEEVESEMFTELHQTVVVPLVGRSRLDGNLLHTTFSWQETFRGRRMAITLHAKPAEPVRLHLDSNGRRQPRSTYRLGTSNVWDKLEWATWSYATVGAPRAGQIGMPTGELWPVYVQEHALRRLRLRLDTYAHADWAEHWLHASMSAPKIVQRTPGGDFMVAYEVQGKRLGYLVVSARHGVVVVRTFLFLTMRNTPEGRELTRRLKITHDEIDYLRLHELSRFTRTDLKDDPALRRLFTECGCGQLFELAEDEHALMPTAQTLTPFAAELKQYVGLAA